MNSPHLPGVEGLNLAKPGTFFTRHQESGLRSSLFTGTVYATGDERMMHQRTGAIDGLALDRPLVFAVSRDRPMIFADWRRDAYVQAGGFWLLVLIASSGLVLYQRRQRAYDRLLAIQELERKQADEALQHSEARFRQTFERNDSVMLLIDPRSGDIADANAAAARFYGYSIEHLKTMRIQQINMLSPDEVADALAQAARHERNVFVFPHRLSDGSVRTVEVRTSPIEAGNCCLLFSIIHDVTERQRSEEALRISESRHRLLADNARDVIWTMAPDGTITYVSPSVETVRGFTPAEAMLQTTEEILTPASRAVSLGYFTQLHADLAADRPTRSFRGELEYRCKDGSTVWTEVMAFPLFSDEGLVELLGVTRDISEHKRLVLELQQARDATETANQALLHANAALAGIAITDALTGVSNRRHFEQVADAAAAQARRYQQPLSLLIFDIDHFKSINDRYGHLAGDHVLIELTQLVGGALRDSDVLARWGGEEFVVIMPHCGASAALLVAQKLRALVAAHPFDAVGTVTVSLGAAEFKPDEGLDDWFRRVDLALYEAKSGGRNTVRLGS